MRKSQERLQDRYLATLLGAAVGDALAYPFQDYSRTFLLSVAKPLVESYEGHVRGLHPEGQFTDDTQSWVALVESVLERGCFEADEVTAEEFVSHLIPLWRDMTVIDADPGCTAVLQEIARGNCEWNEAALGPGRAGCGALTRGLPIGLWHCKDVAAIPASVETVVGVTHTDPRVLAATAGIAAGVAHNVVSEEIILGQLLDQVAAAAAEFSGEVAEAVIDMPRVLSQTDNRALEFIWLQCADEEYPPRPDGTANYCVPILLTAVYEFLKSPQDFERALDRTLRLGGDLCTVASVTAALSAGWLGLDAVPRCLLDQLVEGRELAELAERFFQLRHRLTQRAVQAVDSVADVDLSGRTVDHRADRGGGREGKVAGGRAAEHSKGADWPDSRADDEADA